MIVFDTNSQVWKYILQLPTSVLEAYFKHFGDYYRNKTHSSIYLFISLKYNMTSAEWRMLFYAGLCRFDNIEMVWFCQFLKIRLNEWFSHLRQS